MKSTMKAVLRTAWIVTAVAGLAACQLLQPQPTQQSKPAPKTVEEAPPPQARGAQEPSVQTRKPDTDRRLQEHMAFIELLNRSDTRQLDGIYERVESTFVDKPSTENRLRLAWVFATPGHGHSNLWAARKHLQEASHDHHLSPGMKRFVRLRLTDIKRNLQMTVKLSEANEKIRALTSLEHSMEERDAEVQEE